MKQRNVLLIVSIISAIVLGAPMVAAQDTNVPQAVVNVERTVLRDAPSHAGGFVTALSESMQVALRDIDTSGGWFQVETADGMLGWGRALHFTPLSRARTVRTLVLFEAPDDPINYVTGVEENAEVLILQTDETGEWSRVLAPDGQTGWMETRLLRFDYGVAAENNVVLYNWPDSSSGLPTATLSQMTPVFVKDTLPGGRWIRVQSGAGEAGWAPINQFVRTDQAVRGVIALSGSEMANLRSLPAIDAQSPGTIANGEEVWVAGRDANGRWLLVSSARGQLAWISSGLVELEPGVGIGSLAILVP